jgi:ABC-2 type transport system ATP-binding protein
MWSVEEICKRVAIIDNGRLVTVDRISDLKSVELKRQGSIKIFVKGFMDKQDNLDALSRFKWITNIIHEDQNDYVFTIESNERVKAFQGILLEHFETIENIRINEPTLEDIFISLTKKSNI